jgi:hypothetical protein
VEILEDVLFAGVGRLVEVRKLVGEGANFWRRFG